MGADDRPISLVLHDAVQNIEDIVRSEFRLAKAEVRSEITKARSAGLLVAIAAITGVFAALFVFLTAMYALRRAMPDWLAALTVAIAVAIVACVALSAGLKRFRSVKAAPKTVARLKENVEWAKQQTK